MSLRRDRSDLLIEELVREQGDTLRSLTDQVRRLGGEVEQVNNLALTLEERAIHGGASAPLITGVSGGDGEATVTWSAPADDGGWPLSGYRVNVYRSIYNTLHSSTVVGLVTTFTATGLTNELGYYFVIAAVNAQGNGTASAPSAVVTPGTGTTVRVAGHIPASYSNWVGPGGTYHSLSQRIIWDYNPTPGPGSASSWAWFAAINFGFDAGNGGYMGLQIDTAGKRAIVSIWRALEATASAPGAVASAFGNPRVFHANTTSASAVITSSDAAFVPSDVNRPIEGAGIGGSDFALPNNFIASVDSSTQVTMTVACTATATAVEAIVSDEGFGYHILWPFDWVPGHAYRFELVKSTTPHFWNANMRDETLGTYFDIGYLRVPTSWGDIISATSNFMEWYAAQPAYCDQEVPSSVTFREPIFNFDGTPVAVPWDSDDFNTGGFGTLCDATIVAGSPDGRQHLNGTQP